MEIGSYVPLFRALWSLVVGIWGTLKGSWGLLGCKNDITGSTGVLILPGPGYLKLFSSSTYKPILTGLALCKAIRRELYPQS